MEYIFSVKYLGLSTEYKKKHKRNRHFQEEVKLCKSMEENQRSDMIWYLWKDCQAAWRIQLRLKTPRNNYYIILQIVTVCMGGVHAIINTLSVHPFGIKDMNLQKS